MRRPIVIFMAASLIIAYSAYSGIVFCEKYSSSGLYAVPDEKEVTEDTIEFINGDIMTGSIVSISSSAIEFNGKMISGTSEVPLDNVKRIYFPRGTEEEAKPKADQVIFPNGDCLSISVQNMDENTLIGETITGDPIKLAREYLEGLHFEKVPINVMEEHFEDPEDIRFKSVSGKWEVEGGKYVQTSTAMTENSAFAAVTQQGHYRYQWSVDKSKGGVTGFYFFAQEARSRHGINSYFIMLTGNSVYLYKCIDDNQQYYNSYTIPTSENTVKFDLEYDSGKGIILLKINDKEAMKWQDAEPIDKGKYVILHASGAAAFDDIIIERIGGSYLPLLSAENADEDVVLFINGDILSGSVVTISENEVVIENEYDPEGMIISKSKISSLRLRNDGTGGLFDSAGCYRFVMWNDDIITAKLIGLDDMSLRIESTAVGVLSVPRELVKRIEAIKKAL